ncbi:MAG: chromate transporter [Nocardioidaceae bacterium]
MTTPEPYLQPPPRHDVVPMRTAVRTWFAISLQTFGGPAGQIAVMQRILVDEKRWISQRRFLHALNYCMLLPGPEAQQLAIYIGWLLNGRRGGLIAGTLFVLPGVVALMTLSAAYVGLGDTGWWPRCSSAWRRRSSPSSCRQSSASASGRSPTRAWSALAVAAFVALTFFDVAFPVVVARRRCRRLGRSDVWCRPSPNPRPTKPTPVLRR